MTHLHNYKVVKSHSDAIIEVCQECGHRLVTRVHKDGRINNKQYKEQHKRDFLQPNNKDFKKYYG